MEKENILYCSSQKNWWTKPAPEQNNNNKRLIDKHDNILFFGSFISSFFIYSTTEITLPHHKQKENVISTILQFIVDVILIVSTRWHDG